MAKNKNLNQPPVDAEFQKFLNVYDKQGPRAALSATTPKNNIKPQGQIDAPVPVDSSVESKSFNQMGTDMINQIKPKYDFAKTPDAQGGGYVKVEQPQKTFQDYRKAGTEPSFELYSQKGGTLTDQNKFKMQSKGYYLKGYPEYVAEGGTLTPEEYQFELTKPNNLVTRAIERGGNALVNAYRGGGNVINKAAGIEQIKEPEQFKQFKQYDEEVRKTETPTERFVGDVITAGVQMIPSIAAGGGAGLLLSGMQAGGQNAQQALDEGATAGQAAAFGLGTGIAEGLTERLGFIPGINSAIIKGLGKSVAKNFGKAAIDFGKKSLQEGLEEIIMEPTTGLLQKVTYQPNKKWYGDGGVVDPKAMGYAGLLGTTVGGLMGGAQVPSAITQVKNAAQSMRGLDSIINTAMAMPTQSGAYQTAQAVSQKSQPTYDDYVKLVNEVRTDANLGLQQAQSSNLTDRQSIMDSQMQPQINITPKTLQGTLQIKNVAYETAKNNYDAAVLFLQDKYGTMDIQGVVSDIVNNYAPAEQRSIQVTPEIALDYVKQNDGIDLIELANNIQASETEYKSELNNDIQRLRRKSGLASDRQTRIAQQFGQNANSRARIPLEQSLNGQGEITLPTQENVDTNQAVKQNLPEYITRNYSPEEIDFARQNFQKYGKINPVTLSRSNNIEMDRAKTLASEMNKELSKNAKDIQNVVRDVQGGRNGDSVQTESTINDTQNDTGAKTETLLDKGITTYNAKADTQGVEVVKDETTLLKGLREFYNSFGLNITFYKGDKNGPLGFYLPNTPYRLFVNVENNNNIIAHTTAHESFHALKRNEPELFGELVDYLSEDLSQKQIQDFMESYEDSEGLKKAFEKDPKSIVEEIAANEFANNITDAKWWEELYNKNESLFKKLMYYVKQWLDKITASGIKENNYLTQKQVEVFAKKQMDIMQKAMGGKDINVGTNNKSIDEIRSTGLQSQKENPKLDSNSSLSQNAEKDNGNDTKFAGRRIAKPFFSKLQQVIEQKMPNKSDVETVKNLISPTNGIKLEEAKWSGIYDYLNGKIKVNKADLLDFLRMNDLQIVESTKSRTSPSDEKYKKQYNDILDLRDRGGRISHNEAQIRIAKLNEEFGYDDNPKFSNYTVEGGKNYREMLFMLPSSKKPYSKWVKENEESLIKAFGSIDSPQVKDLYDNHVVPELPKYKSSHWNEGDVLAHTRLDDRVDAEGNKVLFVQEIQSDWHQEGRKKGYIGYIDPTLPEGWRIEKSNSGQWKIIDESNNWQYRGDSREDVLKQFSQNQQKYESLRQQVPDAPFQKTWHEFVVKRLLRYAAESGYDKVAFITGQQAADLYDLSKQVGYISVTPFNGVNGTKLFDVNVRGTNDSRLVSKDEMTIQEVENYLGKEMAEKFDTLPLDKEETFEGDDLKVGGEGMRGFYDKIIPDFLKKYVKKWGATIETETLGETKQPTVTITPQMKDAVLYEGQPLFAGKRKTRYQTNYDRFSIEKLIEGAENWKDKFMPFLIRETWDRNFIDIAGKEKGTELARELISPVKIAEGLRNSFMRQQKKVIKDLNLETRSLDINMFPNSISKRFKPTESELVQKLGEGSVTLDEVKQIKPNSWQKIEKSVKVFRDMYDSLIEQANNTLIANGYPPVPYRKDYFPHFDGSDSIAKQMGFNINMDDLPTDINGLTADFKPGKNFVANFLRRMGNDTTYDAVRGFDAYIEGVSKVIYHTNNIQRLRTFSEALRRRFSQDYIEEKIEEIQKSNLPEELKQEHIQNILESTGLTHLTNVVVDLNEYTNVIAGKKDLGDRSSERTFGRKMYAIVDAFKRRVGANMVALNPASWLTNFIPIMTSAATIGKSPWYTVQGMIDTMANVVKKDGFVDTSAFVSSRYGTDKLYETMLEKAIRKLTTPFKLIDHFVAQSITRAKYYEQIKEGKSHKDAIRVADEWAGKVIGDRSVGAQPTLFNMKDPWKAMFTQFQLEVNNQISNVFKDLPRAYLSKDNKYGIARLMWAILQLFIYNYLFNFAYEKLIGRKPAFDPISLIYDSIYDLKNDKLSREKKVTNIVQRATQQIPFVGSFFGGGRIPVQAAIPDLLGAAQGKTSLKDEAMKPVYYLAFPVGGGQVKKTADGIETVKRGGYYKNTPSGEALQYAVEKTPGNMAKAAVFGRNSLKESQEFYKEGKKGLTAKQTIEQKAIDVNPEEYLNGRDLQTELGKAKSKAEKDRIKADIVTAFKDTGDATVFVSTLDNKLTRTVKGDKQEVELSDTEYQGYVQGIMDYSKKLRVTSENARTYDRLASNLREYITRQEKKLFRAKGFR